MDDSDRATEQEEKWREIAKQYRKPVTNHTGYCLNEFCGIPTLWAYCSQDCQSDHQREVEARIRNTGK